MTFSQSSSVTPAPLDSAWPPAHIWETMGATDRASWLGQIQRDRAKRLELDVAAARVYAVMRSALRICLNALAKTTTRAHNPR
jgi:hypothetical protein